MGLKTWLNGDKAEIIKSIIDSNFKVLGRHLSQNVLALPTKERELLSSEYLSDGLIVFDTTLETYFKYQNGIWREYDDSVHRQSSYSKNILTSDWNNNTLIIPFIEHKKKEPVVQLYILQNNIYLPVIGGVTIDSDGNVILQTDLEFDGKVVIK